MDEQFETLTRGLAPMLSENTQALADLRGVVAGGIGFDKVSRAALAAIRGVAPGVGAANRFDFSSFLPDHWRGAEELSWVISRGIVGEADIEKFARTALGASGTLAPDVSVMTRGIFESTLGPKAERELFGDPVLGSALELKSVVGAGIAKALRGLDLAGFGAGLDPAISRGLLRGLGADFDLARGVVDSSAWSGLPGFTSSPAWPGLLATAEAALDLPVTEPVDELEGDEEAAASETIGIAQRMREMGFWVPIPTSLDTALWLSFLVSVNAVSEAIVSGDPRKVLFAMMSLTALTLAWRSGGTGGD